jgi:hypothetical protein
MRVLSVIVVSLACVMPAFGQAQNPDDLQPGVNTSAMPAQASSAPANAKAAQVGAQVEAALAAADRPGNAAPAAPTASPVTPATPPAAGTASRSAAPAATGKTAKGGKATDRIDLDTTQITGNKELPKVMYVVPWKRADLGDLTGKPANSLVDEVLQPVDRDVFNREERYYHTVAPEKSSVDSQSGSPAAH